MTGFLVKIFGTIYLLNPQIAPVDSVSFDIAPPPQYMEINADITADSMIIFDLENNSEIASKNPDKPHSIASLTKLMTALLILENHDLNETVEVTTDPSTIEGSKAWLLVGEELTVSSLMKALLIHSANDSAVALAIYDAGTTDAFVNKMNARAASLGLQNTHFKNPHGLDEEGHYSTARDLAFLSAFLLKKQNSFFRDTVNTKETTIYSTDSQISHKLETTNDLLKEDYPIFGLKTGTTDSAGQCLITLVKARNREYLIVILGSQDRYGDTRLILDQLL